MNLQRRIFIVTFTFLCTLSACAHAQQPAPRSGWQRVKALSPGIVIDIKSNTKHIHCKLADVTEDTLTCIQSSATTSEVFQRTAIVWIKIGHRGRSALIGAGIGGATLATVGFAAASNQGGFFGPDFLRGSVTAVGGAAGAVIGAGIGALTDFSKSTIYKAPYENALRPVGNN